MRQVRLVLLIVIPVLAFVLIQRFIIAPKDPGLAIGLGLLLFVSVSIYAMFFAGKLPK